MYIGKQSHIQRRAIILLVVLLLLAVAPPTEAQEVAIGTATATVLSAVTVTATAALAFGNVYQGVTASIANNNASAAIFTISGQANAGVTLYFQLPEYLTLTTGGDRMNISFSATDASIDTTGANNPATMAGTKGWQDTDPRGLPSTATIGSAGTSVYLGGKVYPSAFQQAGSYSADIILTVSYNGT